MALGTGRRVVAWLVGVVGVLVVLVVALALLLQSSAVSQRVLAVVLPRASAALGRQVTVQSARLRIFPPSVALQQAAVAGRPGEPPLVQLDAFDVKLALWPLVRSLGKEVEVTGLRLVHPVLNLVRAPDGTWNYEGLGGDAGQQPAAPAQPAGQRADVVVSRASIEDGEVHLIDRAAGGNAAVAVSKIDLDARDVGPGHPLDARLSAALAGAQKNFSAELHASRLPASAAELGPGRYPDLTGALALNGLELAQLRAFLPPSVTGTMTGGRVDASAKLSTADGRYRVDGSGKLSQVRLRGQPAQGSFDLLATADPATGAAHAAISHLVLRGPGVDVGGEATADLPARGRAGPTRVRFALAGPLLDLGQVMGLLPAQQQPPEQQKPFALTAAQRRAVQALDVQGTVKLDKVVRGGLVATGFAARAVLERGAFVLEQAGADFFGGHVDASGTRLDLAPAQPAWDLRAKLAGVDLGQALKSFAGTAPVLGKLDGTLALKGAGVEWAQLQKALTGEGAIGLKQGALTTTDLGSQVLGALSKGLQAAGRGGAASTVSGAAGQTALRDLAARFTVQDGAMALSRPLQFQAPFGAVSLGGKIGLGGALGLQGTATVPRSALQPVVGAAGLTAPASTPVPLRLGGTLDHPAVSVDAQQAVAGLLRGAVEQKAAAAKGAVEQRAKEEAKKGLGGILQGLGSGR